MHKIFDLQGVVRRHPDSVNVVGGLSRSLIPHYFAEYLSVASDHGELQPKLFRCSDKFYELHRHFRIGQRLSNLSQINVVVFLSLAATYGQ